MASTQDLISYFTDGVDEDPPKTWGMEVETFAVDSEGSPANAVACQRVFGALVRAGWVPFYEDDSWVGYVTHPDGTIIKLEQGYHCFEQVSAVCCADSVVAVTKAHQRMLYDAFQEAGLRPLFTPVIEYDGNLLAPEDPRSAMWLTLDGVESAQLPARTASVQFTFAVRPDEAVAIINRLNAARSVFLADYPQDALWREHMVTSNAGYRADRYGGPMRFESIEHYCAELSKHGAIVDDERLVPFEDATISNVRAIELFVKSIWWYHRLRRYGNVLCIESRPYPRRSDAFFPAQYELLRRVRDVR